MLRRQIPLGITFVIGLFFILEYFFVTPREVSTLARDMGNWGVVVTAFAMTLGTIILTRTHGTHVWKRTKGQWYYSAILLVIMYTFLIVGVSIGSTHSSYQWLYNSTYAPLNATLYCSILPFIATACLRAFRARSREGAAVLIAGGLVMVGNMTMVEMVAPFFPDIREWIMTVPNMAAYRGITIGAGLGTLLLGLRTLLGYERGYMGARE